MRSASTFLRNTNHHQRVNIIHMFDIGGKLAHRSVKLESKYQQNTEFQAQCIQFLQSSGISLFSLEILGVNYDQA